MVFCRAIVTAMYLFVFHRDFSFLFSIVWRLGDQLEGWAKFNEFMQASGPMTLDAAENGRNYLAKRKL
jgi:hypothetical protein